MPYFKNDTINILQIHIPKTGGSSLESYFSNKYNIPLDIKSLLICNSSTTLSDGTVLNSSPQHFTYKTLVKYKDILNIDFNNIIIMTIIRNPYERIMSDLFYLRRINKDTSRDDVSKIIIEYLSETILDNHNIPQYLFVINDDNEIIPNLKILHTKTLTQGMKMLGFNDFNIKINSNSLDVNYYSYLNESSIANINNYYHYDFVFFNYKKLNMPIQRSIQRPIQRLIQIRIPIQKQKPKPNSKPKLKIFNM